MTTRDSVDHGVRYAPCGTGGSLLQDGPWDLLQGDRRAGPRALSWGDDGGASTTISRDFSPFSHHARVCEERRKKDEMTGFTSPTDTDQPPMVEHDGRADGIH